MHTSEIKILLNLPSIILVLIFLSCADIEYANFIFITGARATYLVLAGDLVLTATTLVTPAIEE